jgi:hypothetical protein
LRNSRTCGEWSFDQTNAGFQICTTSGFDGCQEKIGDAESLSVSRVAELLLPHGLMNNTRNEISGYGSLGLQAEWYVALYGSHPNFLLSDCSFLVDMALIAVYDESNGSVIQAVARLDRFPCLANCSSAISVLRSAGVWRYWSVFPILV